MTRNSGSTATAETTPEAVSNSTPPMEVSPELTPGLIAAWDGVYHLLGGRASWEITPVGLIAHDFTMNEGFDPEEILSFLNSRERRVSLFPAINWINGEVPAGFKTPAEVQAFLTQYFKGSTGDGSTRVAANIRGAAKAYRAANMHTGRPGPKPKILGQLAKLEANQVKEMDAETLDHLQSVLDEVRASQAAAELVTA